MALETRKIELILQELIRRANRTDRRLRILEQRTQALETRLSSLEDSNFKQNKEIKKRFIDLEVVLRNINEKLIMIESEVNRISNEIKQLAKKSEVKELEALFSLFSPLENEFVTRKEIREIVKEELKKEREMIR
jgi:uncharacterized protein (DUF342 family)